MTLQRFILTFISLIILNSISIAQDDSVDNEVRLIILGTCQDAGSPHIDCFKECCTMLSSQDKARRKVVSLGIIDNVNQKKFLVEATPDITDQLNHLFRSSNFNKSMMPDGIFLTHAHIGHYTGLMYLGKEAKNSSSVPVYVMPGMKKFLQENGPWSQLVNNKNIILRDLHHETELGITSNLKITPFLVPHRDEYSETVGYKISGPNRNALFIPDIDKWEKWSENILEEIRKVDYAFIDATFYDGKEIGYRDISQIPHPFVIETMETLKSESSDLKNKVYFIHLNHTNPLLDKKSIQYNEVIKNGFNVAEIFSVFTL